MDKKPLIGVSICAVVLLILGSLSNVVGYQTVESSNQKTINEEINPKELLFQTIVDIANNKDIQGIILKSQISRGDVLNSNVKIPTFNTPVLTMKQLKQMYLVGLILSKIISKARMHSMIEKYQIDNQVVQKEINAVIEKNATVNREIKQLLSSDCGCDDSNTTKKDYPIICNMLEKIMYSMIIVWFLLHFIMMIPPSANDDILNFLLYPWQILYEKFDCYTPPPPPNYEPVISDVIPADGEQNVLLSTSELQFRIEDREGDLMDYTVETYPFIGEGNGTQIPNGTYTIPIHGLQNNTNYTWKIHVITNQHIDVHYFTFTTATLAPCISNPLPKHNTHYLPISLSNVSFDLKCDPGELMNWTAEIQPNIGFGHAKYVGNGRYTVAIRGLKYDKNYTWFVNATDGTYWTRKTYFFTTAAKGLMVFEPSADTYVTDHEPDETRWMIQNIILSKKDSGIPSCWDERGLVLFNLTEIPTGSQIMSANLSLYYSKYHNDTNPVGREITCHRILENWDEMTVTWNTMPNSSSIECASMFLPAYFTWVDWNVTSEVNDFINGGVENYGWMIRDYKDPVRHYCNIYFYSSNAANFNLHPRLFVWFNPP